MIRLTASMAIDFAGCYIIEVGCKFLFAELEPKKMITRGRERREKRRKEQEALKKEQLIQEKLEKKAQ
jgi:manganese-transporting P-type ATPase